MSQNHEPRKSPVNKTGTGETKKKNRKLQAALVLTLCILAVLIALVYAYYSGKLSLLQHSDGTVEVEGTIDETEEDVRADAAEMEQQTSDLEEREVVQAEGEIFGDDDVFNILLIGTDERTKEFNINARGDSCMLLSINKKDGNIRLVSFERGMGVPILAGQYQGQYDWLTHTFRYGGADLMMQEIRECFKVDVTRYVRVNFATFEQIINSVGGVDIELSELEYLGLTNQVRTNAVAKADVHVGMNHLDGYDALQYARLRYIDNDWHRIERQRDVMQSVFQQLKKLNLLELNSLLDEVLPLVQTNLTDGDITNLLLLAPKLMNAEIMEKTIPESGTYGSMTGMGGRSMFAVDFAQNAQILKDFLYAGAA